MSWSLVAQAGGSAVGSRAVPACFRWTSVLAHSYRRAAEWTEEGLRRPQSHRDRARKAPRMSQWKWAHNVVTESLRHLMYCHFSPFVRCCRMMCWPTRPRWRRWIRPAVTSLIPVLERRREVCRTSWRTSTSAGGLSWRRLSREDNFWTVPCCRSGANTSLATLWNLRGWAFPKMEIWLMMFSTWGQKCPLLTLKNVKEKQ